MKEMHNIDHDRVLELFDYKDGGLYWKKLATHRKQNVKVGDRAGFISNDGYRTISIRHTLYREHRLIFMYHNGRMPNFVDHIDGDKQNNRIENLREATHAQNMQNSTHRKNNTSGIKGVSKHRNKWVVNLSIDGKTKYIGLFHNIEDAKACVISARNTHHGEFARHA